MAKLFLPNLVLVLVFISLTAAEVRQVLLESWAFEDEPTETETWRAVTSELALDGQAYSGGHAALFTQRRSSMSGIGLKVPVEEGSMYYIKGHFKLLNTSPGSTTERVTLKARFLNNDDFISTFTVSLIQYQQVTDEFVPVSGDFRVPEGVNAVDMRLDVVEAVDYVFDDAEFYEVITEGNWKKKADEAIAQHRMNDITIRVKLPSKADLQDYSVKVEQTSHDFAFGTAVRASKMTGSDDASLAYQEFFFDNFEWAVLENDLKWRQLEREEGVLNYSPVDEVLNLFEQYGIPCRGHAVFWDGADKNPDWVAALSGNKLVNAMWAHQEATMKRYANRTLLKHWDVNNEILAGQFYEEASGRYDLLPEMFERAHAFHPEAQLFMNEYRVMNSDGTHVQAYLNVAKSLLDSGVPLQGIGIQSHLKNGVDLPLMERRLNAMAELGLPLWITEMTVNEPDMDIRAQGYEDALRLYFSHPAVDGVLLWGFWDGAHYDPTAVLVEGDDFTINLAGEKFLKLLSNWTTNKLLGLSGKKTTHTFAGYHGEYKATVYLDGDLVAEKKFKLRKGKNVEVDVKVVAEDSSEESSSSSD